MGVVNMYRFNGNRYLTKGIQNEIPLELQIILWFMIDDNIKKSLKMDYLQIFELSPYYKNDKIYQKIIHHQEVPKRKSEKILNIFEKPITAKIYVIDDSSHCTMLFNHEY